MTSGMLPEEKRNLERQMGCMAGFFQLFDRHQILAGKRIYSTRRLPSSPGTSSSSPSERSDFSPPSFTKDSSVQTPKKSTARAAPASPPLAEEAAKDVAASPTTPSRPSAPLPLPVLEFKGAKTSWKLREAPRLSLDSRLLNEKGRLEIRTTQVPSDVSDDQRRSPSVVARLMGLELFPKSESGVDGDTVPNVAGAAQLERSASESRASKEFLHYSFFHEKSSQERRAPAKPDPKPKAPAKQKPAPPMVNRSGGGGGVQMRKSSFDAQDFFPEPSKRSGNGNLYGEIEKKLWMAQDLDSLKQILEALQLKGLLHARSSPLRQHQMNGRNLFFERQQPPPRSPIVLMKPASTVKSQSPSRFGATSSPGRNTGRRDRAAEIGARRGRNNSNGRIPPDPTSPSSAARRKRYSPPVQSPRSGSSPRRSLPPSLEHTTNTSTRIRKTAASIERFSDESSTISDSSSHNNHAEVEKVKVEEFREGRNLLKRCDRLLQSISEITSPAPTQPSPVSVLDSAASFRSDGGDERSPPDSTADQNRRIEFGDAAELMGLEVDDATWTPLPAVPTIQHHLQQLVPVDDVEATDHDFGYVAEIFRSYTTTAAAASTPQLDVYFSLEKQYEEEEEEDPYFSSSSSSHRRVVFDTVAEIVERKNQHLISSSPWTAFARSRSVIDVDSTRVPARETWTELKRLLDPVSGGGDDDLCELVCGVLRKDLTSSCSEAQRGWSDRSFELSDAVLDIERLIFKDLVADTIRDLSTKSRRPPPTTTTTAVSRRKLLF